MNNFIGLFLSYLLIVIILIIVYYLEKFKLKRCYIRKVIHLVVSHWWIIAIIYFDTFIYALIPPTTFLIANILSRRFNLIKAMEEDNKTLGTIFYPISMIILTIICFGVINRPHVGLIGMLIMGYGDGLASIFGMIYGKTCLYQKKTVIGTTTMFVVSFIISAIVIRIFNNHAFFVPGIILALTATVTELYSPRGTDNLTVPIIISLIYNYIYYIY